MNHYDNFSQPPIFGTSSAESARSLRLNYRRSEQEEHGSLSESEDGNYALYHDSSKNDLETEEDGSTTLTSQTLNADGTPKRPMNAFMIFARRRRPQVSADNQSLRTGEISKILSKEWTSMPTSEKQFYQEQAKHLKETFNTRYPDYVYRRRPNNSRRRKRSDPNLRSGDNFGDLGDDGLGGGEFESSPTDGDESHFDSIHESSYARALHSHGFEDHPKFGPPTTPRSSGHPYSQPDGTYRTNGTHESRPSYMSSPPTDRLGHNLEASSRIPQSSHHSLHYSYLSSQAQSPTYSTDADSHDVWQTRIERGPPGWLNSSQDRGSNSTSNSKPNNFSGSSSSWSNLPSSTGSSQHSNSNYSFPTLTAPFYPSQSNGSGFQSNAAQSAAPSNQYEPSTHLHSGSISSSRDFDSRDSANSYLASSSRDPLMYSQRSMSSRDLPPVQSITGYPPSHHITSANPRHSGTLQGFGLNY